MVKGARPTSVFYLLSYPVTTRDRHGRYNAAIQRETSLREFDAGLLIERSSAKCQPELMVTVYALTIPYDQSCVRTPLRRFGERRLTG